MTYFGNNSRSNNLNQPFYYPPWIFFIIFKKLYFNLWQNITVTEHIKYTIDQSILLSNKICDLIYEFYKDLLALILYHLTCLE